MVALGLALAPQAWAGAPCDSGGWAEDFAEQVVEVEVLGSGERDGSLVLRLLVEGHDGPVALAVGRAEGGIHWALAAEQAVAEGVEAEAGQRAERVASHSEALAGCPLRDLSAVQGAAAREVVDMRAPPVMAPGSEHRTRSRDPWSRRYVHFVLPALWVLLLLAGAFALWGRRRALAWEELRWVAGAVGLHVALMLFLAPGGPGDIAFNLSMIHRPPAELTDFGLYGRTPEALIVLLLGPLVAPSEFVIMGLSGALAAGSIPLIGALARQLGLGQVGQRVAMLGLATLPLHVRFGPTYNRYMFVIGLVLVGWVLLLVWLERRRSSDLVGSFCALTLAPQARPDALLLPALTLLLLLALWGDQRRRGQIKAALTPLVVAGVLHAAALALPLRSVLERALANERWATMWGEAVTPLFSPTTNAFLSPSMTPWLLPVLAVVALLSARGSLRWTVLWLVGSALAVTGLTSAQGVAESDFLDARYQLAAQPLYVLLAAFGAEGARAAMGWGAERALRWLIAGLMLTSLVPLRSTLRVTTMDAEYAFFREHLQAVPDGCAIVAYEPDWDLGLRAPWHLSPSLGREHRWILTRRDPMERLEDSPCVVLAHIASCSSETHEPGDVEGQDALCRQLRGRTLGALAEATVPNEPAGGHTFAGDTLEVGLYWLRRP